MLTIDNTFSQFLETSGKEYMVDLPFLFDLSLFILFYLAVQRLTLAT